MARLTPTRKLDTAFGVNGSFKADVPALGGGAIDQIRLQSDGSIVFAGDSFSAVPVLVVSPPPPLPGTGPRFVQVSAPPAPANDEGIVVGRLTPTGALDCSFGSYGFRVIQSGSLWPFAGAVAMDLDFHDRVVVGAGLFSQQAAEPMQLVARVLNGTASTPPPAAPTVYTGDLRTVVTLDRPADPRAATTLQGWIDPRCQDTRWHIQYGPTASYGKILGGPVIAGAGGPQKVSVPIGELPAGTYHYRLVASNATATSYGADGVFRVLAPAYRFAGASQASYQRVGTVRVPAHRYMIRFALDQPLARRLGRILGLATLVTPPVGPPVKALLRSIGRNRYCTVEVIRSSARSLVPRPQPEQLTRLYLGVRDPTNPATVIEIVEPAPA